MQERKAIANIKIDTAELSNDKDEIALQKMKAIERKKASRCKLYQIPKGYVITNNPEKYKHIINEK